ncbi:MAG: hypothetical protein F4187_06390 [Gemmatimonadetes bacterium]|nr:hypothetical protein [Gemmatimonadota bacterium]
MTTRKPFLLSAGLVATLTVWGCVWWEDPGPETVRVTMEGEAETFLVVTSTEFVAANNEAGDMSVQLFEADTTVVSLPFDRSWDISAEQRFFLMGTPVDSSAVRVQVRIYLDGDKDFDRNVDAMTEDPVRYIYLFNQQILQDFELL